MIYNESCVSIHQIKIFITWSKKLPSWNGVAFYKDIKSGKLLFNFAFLYEKIKSCWRYNRDLHNFYNYTLASFQSTSCQNQNQVCKQNWKKKELDRKGFFFMRLLRGENQMTSGSTNKITEIMIQTASFFFFTRPLNHYFCHQISFTELIELLIFYYFFWINFFWIFVISIWLGFIFIAYEFFY